jgi:putative heme transporter
MAEDGDEQTERQQAEDAEANVRHASRSLRNGLISLGLLIVLVVGLVLAVPGLKSVGNAITRMSPGWVAAGVALEILSCAGYVLAFLQVFERAPLRFGARVALSELAFGAAVSLGGAGSLAVGGWLLVERGAPVVRVAERSAVLFWLTSAINVITLVLAGLGVYTGVLPGPDKLLLTLAPAAVGALLIALVLTLPRVSHLLAARLRPGKLRTGLIETARSVQDTKRLLLRPDWRIIGAIGYLWFDIGVLVACFAALGRVPPLGPLVLAYQLGYLSNFIPIPGNLGVLDASFVGLLVVYGVNATDATAATLVYHAIALWIPAMWGSLAFLLLRRTRRQPLRAREPRHG